MHEALLGAGKTGTQGLGRSQDLQLPAVDRPPLPLPVLPHNYKHTPGSPCGKENASWCLTPQPLKNGDNAQLTEL